MALVREHLPSFIERAEGDGASLPTFALDDLEGVLRCGDFEHRFVRLNCGRCGDELRVPFSYESRSSYPSCAGRRMNELAPRSRQASDDERSMNSSSYAATVRYDAVRAVTASFEDRSRPGSVLVCMLKPLQCRSALLVVLCSGCITTEDHPDTELEVRSISEIEGVDHVVLGCGDELRNVAYSCNEDGAELVITGPEGNPFAVGRVTDQDSTWMKSDAGGQDECTGRIMARTDANGLDLSGLTNSDAPLAFRQASRPGGGTGKSWYAQCLDLCNGGYDNCKNTNGDTPECYNAWNDCRTLCVLVKPFGYATID